jgi:hypothetical protein
MAHPIAQGHEGVLIRAGVRPVRTQFFPWNDVWFANILILIFFFTMDHDPVELWPLMCGLKSGQSWALPGEI